jgi:hypothetical protein
VKLARRRPLPGPDAADDTPPPPTRPRGSPVAAFAGILDGQRLWLAIEERPGSLALRDAGSGDVVAPENEVTDDQPGYRSARLELGELPGDAEATYDVVLVPSGGRSPKPVWSPPLAVPPPRPAEDGRTQYRLARTDAGMLQVLRERAEEAAELRAVRVVEDGLRLIVAGTGSTLALLADGEPIATFPTSPDEAGRADTVGVTIDTGSVPPPREQPAQVAIGEPGAWVPIRRRASDLAEPGRGAPLPSITDQAGRDRLRLRWSPRALLLARPLDPETEAEE